MKSSTIDTLDLSLTDLSREDMSPEPLDKESLVTFKRIMEEHLSFEEPSQIPSPIELCTQTQEEPKNKEAYSIQQKPCLEENQDLPFEKDTFDDEDDLFPKKKDQIDSSLGSAFALFTPTFSSFKGESSRLIETPSITKLSPATLDAFSVMERVCTEMMVLTSEGSTQTTLFLNNPEFSSSVFYGAEITIEEFSSAPKIFNVKIIAAPQAVELLQSHLGNFMQNFQERKFPFSINRIDTDLSPSSKSLFSRKGKTEGEDFDDDQQGKKQS